MKAAGSCVAAMLLLVACSSGSTAPRKIPPSATRASSTAAQATAAASSSWIRRPSSNTVKKVLVFIEENHSLSQMKSGMPYLYSQAKRYGYASNYAAITHPSEPNYLAILGGSTVGDTADHNPAFQVSGRSAMTVAKGRSSKAYLESATNACQQGDVGHYAVKHNPWASFIDERTACDAADLAMGTTSSGRFTSDIASGALPNVGYAVPNLDDDAHDGSLATADAWLKRWLAKLYAGPDWKSRHLAIVVTADEDDRNHGNKVLTTVIHPSQSGHVVMAALTHYSLTTLLTSVGHEPCLAEGCSAPSFAGAFGLTID